MFWNFASFKSAESAEERITKIVQRLIKDERVEVREKASKVLGGLIHCSFITKESSLYLLNQFKQDVSKKIRKRINRKGSFPEKIKAVGQYHYCLRALQLSEINLTMG